MEIRKLGAESSGKVNDIIASWQNEKSWAFGISLWTSFFVQSELEHALCFGCWNKDQLQAFLFIKDLGEAYEVTAFAAHRFYARKGIGKQLFDRALELLEQKKQIWLDVHLENHPALCFYKAFGFQESGRRKAFYNGGGDAILMTLKR